MIKTICDYCGGITYRRLSHYNIYKRKFCDNKCRLQYQIEHKDELFSGKNNPNFKNVGFKICKQCGKEYKTYISNRKYCSYKCYIETHRIIHICSNCNKEFIIYKSRKKGELKFCSRNCQINYNVINRNITKICPVCKKEFSIPLSENRRIFCSVDCVYKFKNDLGLYSGANNPRWIGGTVTYRGSNWIEQRKKVYERDEHKCRKCGEQLTKIDVHHIIPYRISKNNDLDNLICLCSKCHAYEDYFFTKFKYPSQWLREIIGMISNTDTKQRQIKV